MIRDYMYYTMPRDDSEVPPGTKLSELPKKYAHLNRKLGLRPVDYNGSLCWKGHYKALDFWLNDPFGTLYYKTSKKNDFVYYISLNGIESGLLRAEKKNCLDDVVNILEAIDVKTKTWRERVKLDKKLLAK